MATNTSLFSEEVPAQSRRCGENIALIIGAFGFLATLIGRVLEEIFALSPAGIAQTTRSVLFLFALFALPCLSPAQQGGSLTQAYATADSQLSAAYKQALSKFTPTNQEMMRRAERAWLAFSESEKNLVISILGQNAVPYGSGREAIIGEVIIRRTHLQTMFGGNSVPTALPYGLQYQDQALTKTYADCMSRLNERNRQLLKEAERAWIAYRDADSASMLAAYGNPTIATAASANLTSTREAQIAGIIQALKLGQGGGPKSSIQDAPPSAVQNNGANPEDAKAVAEFRKQAIAVLKTLLENREGPFFKRPEGLRNAPELPTEFLKQISTLEAQYQLLSRMPDFAKVRDSISNEWAAIQLLASWSRFTKELKTGGVGDAGVIIQKALSLKPKDAAAEYLPLWQSASRWDDVYRDEEPKFQEHLRKGKAFADLGKTSDAIKEYQAAYEIIDNATIAEKIKKIREQSLGL